MCHAGRVRDLSNGALISRKVSTGCVSVVGCSMFKLVGVRFRNWRFACRSKNGDRCRSLCFNNYVCLFQVYGNDESAKVPMRSAKLSNYVQGNFLISFVLPIVKECHVVYREIFGQCLFIL